MDWFEFKNWLELSTGLDRDSLHIYAGVGVQLAMAFLLRRSLASPIPWLFVVAVALANEYYDYSFIPARASESVGYYDEGIRDVWNTLLLPSLLFAIARFWPNLLTGRRKANAQAESLAPAKSEI